MVFHSILWLPEHAKAWEHEIKAPDSFPDLNLDRVVNDIISNHKYKEYELGKFYYRLLTGKEAVVYRQQIFQDLQDSTKLELIRDFAYEMKRAESRIRSAGQYPYKYQKERVILDSAKIYCDAVAALSAAIVRADFKSTGFLAFADLLAGYVNSDEFKMLAKETESLEKDLLNVDYSLIIRSDGVIIRRFAPAQDYTAELAREELNGVECSLQIVTGDDQAEQKRAFVEKLGALDTVSLGNGNNDMKMLEASGLGIAVIGGEGAAISALSNADIIVCSIIDGLDLLLKPDRIKATLRVA